MAKEQNKNGMKKIILIMGSVVCLLLITYVVRWILTGSPNPFTFEAVPKETIPNNQISDGETKPLESESATDIETESTDISDETEAEPETEKPITFDEEVIEAISDMINSYSTVIISKTVKEASWDASFMDVPAGTEYEVVYVDYFALNVKDHTIKELYFDAASDKQYAMYHSSSEAYIADTSTDNAPYYPTDEPSLVDYESYDNLTDFINALLGVESFRVIGSDRITYTSGDSIYYKYADTSYKEEGFDSQGAAEVYMGFYGNELPQECFINLWRTEDGKIIQRTVTYEFLQYSNDEIKAPSNRGE